MKTWDILYLLHDSDFKAKTRPKNLFKLCHINAQKNVC